MQPFMGEPHKELPHHEYQKYEEPTPPSNEELIGKLIVYLFGELGPLARHIRAGGAVAALTLIVGALTTILADPELYAAVVLIGSLIAGIIGQTVQATRLSAKAHKESARIYGE